MEEKHPQPMVGGVFLPHLTPVKPKQPSPEENPRTCERKGNLVLRSAAAVINAQAVFSSSAESRGGIGSFREIQDFRRREHGTLIGTPFHPWLWLLHVAILIGARWTAFRTSSIHERLLHGNVCFHTCLPPNHIRLLCPNSS